jgi:uncharacterized Zn-binding protein involved in type VI secretion
VGGFPAARLTDPTVHGGMIVMGCPTVMINDLPAARIGDTHVCPMVTVLVPHVGGPLVLGSFTVIVGGMPQSRVTDMLICVGPPDTVINGSTNVMVGMAGAAGALGVLKGLAMGGLATLKRWAGGGYPRAVRQPDGSIITEYTKGIHLAGSSQDQARNIAQLKAVSVGPDGDAFLNSIGSAKHPVTVNVIGDVASRRNLHPGQQSYQNCAVQSAQQIVHEATGNNYTEAQMENLAVNPSNSGYTRNGGTPPGGEAVILQNSGVPAHMEPGTTANVDQALASGRGVISGHDAGALWNNPAYAGGGHDVNTIAAIQDDQGNSLGYVINDTGANQQGRTVPAANYASSMDGGPIAVTDNPI